MNKEIVGQKTDPKTVVVEAGRLILYAEATGQKDPVYLSEKEARKAGHPTLPMPPTFMSCLNAIAPPKDILVLKRLGVDISRVLHGEEEYEYFEQIYAGDVLTLQDEFTDIFEKKGGALTIVKWKTTYTNEKGVLVGQKVSTMVIR